MSLCNECWGKGWIEKQGVQFDCRKCKGTGVIENVSQTNEEWAKSLNTDEFADFLEGVAFDSNFRNGIEAEYRREDKDYCYGDRPKIIRAWLKEIHNDIR